ncbi:MAG TPA: hypothetical protein PLP36_08935, partial [Candidatus Methanoculleus thermohydrogenotrophicum]|nr:hypothetical protein [Candidatus Methanoculleus thermohydrogenotrophicum]
TGSTSVSGGAVTQIGISRDHENNQKILQDPASFIDSNCCHSAETCCHSRDGSSPRVSPPLLSRPGVPLFLEVLSLKSGYQEIMKIIKKYSRILLRSLTATAVTLLKPAVIQGMGVVPGSLLLS